jgi:hypothetical protein
MAASKLRLYSRLVGPQRQMMVLRFLLTGFVAHLGAMEVISST